jgi:hypothetical protein
MLARKGNLTLAKAVALIMPNIKKPLFVALALASFLAAPAFAEKPQVKPYAAGSPSGGIPLWNPGDKFVAIASGACSGRCPVYELYVFEDGRVVFSGKKDTGKLGIFRKQVAPDAYAELLTTIVRTRVLDDDIKRGSCLKGRPMLIVMKSTPDGQSMVTNSLNPGCEKHSYIAKQIESLFIEWTEVANWIASK